MKKMVWLMLLVMLLTACGAQPTETPTEETEICGAPLYVGPAEEPDETVQVEFTCESGMIVVQLPVDWQWEVDEITEDAYAVGISFRPGTETEGWLRLQYYPSLFGVCGTGLEQQDIIFANGQAGRLGFYDGRESWSFISFYPDVQNYALTVDGADWVMACEQQIFDILATVQFG